MTVTLDLSRRPATNGATSTGPERPALVGLSRTELAQALTQAGVAVADGASLMVEILADNASPEAGAVYEALGMDWSILVGQVRSSAA